MTTLEITAWFLVVGSVFFTALIFEERIEANFKMAVGVIIASGYIMGHLAGGILASTLFPGESARDKVGTLVLEMLGATIGMILYLLSIAVCILSILNV